MVAGVNMRIGILSTAALLVVATALVAQEPSLTQNSSYFSNLGSVVVADLADDSRPAMIGIDGSSGSSVVVLKNLGNGKYGPPTYYPVTGGLAGIAVGDFNGDGKLDVAVAIGVYGGTSKVAILRGKGDTTLEKPVYYPVPVAPNSIVVADFNNDNRPDIAVIGTSDDFATNTVTILTNTGSSFTEHSFAAPTYFSAAYSYPDDDYISNLVEGDFNGDGRIDLAYLDTCQQCDPSSQVFYVLANLTSGWKGSTVSGGGGALSLTAADIDGDGITDLIIPWHGCYTPCVGVTVLYMDKNFSVAKSVELNVLNDYYGPIPAQVVVGDFNNDGITDIAGYSHGGLDQNQNAVPDSIDVWTGAGNRTFNNPKYYNQSPIVENDGYGGGYTAAGFLTSYPGRNLIVPESSVGSDSQVWKNSTTETHDPCPYPTAASGIHVCKPAEDSPRGTVQFLASARSSVQPLNRIELWVDGTKEVQIFADRLHFELPLANGKHTASFFEVGASGLKTEKRVEFTVGK